MKTTIPSYGDTVPGVIKQLMHGWNVIHAAAKREFPNASEEEIYQITAAAMNKSLGIEKASGSLK